MTEFSALFIMITFLYKKTSEYITQAHCY